MSAATGAPLAVAAVEVIAVVPERPSLALAAMTGADGRYTWDLQAGAWDVRASAEGHAPATMRVVVAAGVTVIADFALEPLA